MMEALRALFQRATNSIGTIAGVLSALTIWLAKNGCLESADVLTSKCSVPWLPVSWMPYLSGLFIALLFAGKLLRPGGILRSLLGGTAVVVADTSPKSGVGTVTPEQVKAP